MSQHSGSILVTGANGQLGRRLLRRLAEERPGTGLRALVRSRRAADSLRALCDETGAQIEIVDYADPARITAAATGCGAAVHLVGILKATRTNPYEEAHERSCEALVAAAEATGLSRIVYLSILGSRPDASNACLASKGRAERILRSGPVETLILRVPMVLGPGDPASRALRRQAEAGRVRLVRGGASLEQPIAADDVVSAITAGLSLADLPREPLELAGPESLSHRALVERAARVLGTQVEIGSVPLWVARGFARLAAWLMADPPLTPAMLGVLEHDDRIDPAPAARRLGIELTPLTETLRRAFADGGPCA